MDELRTARQSRALSIDEPAIIVRITEPRSWWRRLLRLPARQATRGPFTVPIDGGQPWLSPWDVTIEADDKSAARYINRIAGR